MCYILFPQQQIIAIPPHVATEVAALTAEVASVVVVQGPDILAARVQQVRFSISIIIILFLSVQWLTVLLNLTKHQNCFKLIHTLDNKKTTEPRHVISNNVAF